MKVVVSGRQASVREKVGNGRNVLALAALLLLASLPSACRGKERPEIRPGRDACNRCNMTIDQPNQAAGYMLDDRFVTFDSPICLLRALEERRKAELRMPAEIFFADFDSDQLKPATQMFFLLTTHRPTVMSSETLAFASAQGANRAKREPDELVTDWIGLQTLRGTPDRTVQVEVSPEGMQPALVAAQRGELLEWQVQGKGLSAPISLQVRGYERLGTIPVPADGTPVTFRMLADRPGAGFPIQRVDDGKPLGTVKVEGLHTPEEAYR